MQIELVLGDITQIPVDAIVNAANSSLLGGGGVDGAIHRGGGAAILEECKKIVEHQGACPTGEAVITTAGNLPAKYVIHTVGPLWHGGLNNEEEHLAACYRNSLNLAATYGCKTISFPCISTGVYRYPKDKAAKVAANTIRQLNTSAITIEKILFVCFDDENYQYLSNELNL